MDYPAKILLFGEYGIILNSMALAIPYPRFSGRFKFSGTSTNHQLKTDVESNEALKKLLIYLKSNAPVFEFLNIEHFEDEVNQGLYFDSSVPVSSGFGSSGAITAAIYERYLIYSQHNEYQTIKTDLAAIETYFQGKSSGFDPLISLLNKPILKGSHSSFISDINLSPFFNTYTLFLINSHSKGKTSNRVNFFIEQYRHQHFKERIDNEYIPIINQTIKAVTEPDFGSFETMISRYSEFQLSHFGEMIHPGMRTHFEYGTESGDFHLKLCGSGGGKFMLGIARDRFKAESYFNLNHLDWTIV
ncbi:MAG: hypothetical protein NTY07_18705 [Bacteroidia bacterium]|nr:hypothetical protein [Bacteroidia bacterium]